MKKMKKLMFFLTMVLGLMFLTNGGIMAADGQVDLYPDKNFDARGGTYVLSFGLDQGQNQKSVPTLNGDWNDQISSVRVGKGIKVTLYQDAAMGGDKIVLYPGEYKDFSMNFAGNPWNDKASSLKIEKLSDPNLPLIKLTFYSGFTQMIGLDGIDEFKGDWCLLRDNDVEYAEIPPEYKVTFYEDFRYEKYHNAEPIEGGKNVRIRMDDLGLRAKVSSIKIEWKKYKLTKVKMEKIGTEALLTAESLPMAGSFDCVNNSSQKTTCKKNLQSTYTATGTTTWNNETTVGITATTTVSATAGVEGVASGSVEESLALSVANSFAFGREDSISTAQQVQDEVSVEVEGGKSVAFDLIVTPATIKYNVQYTYSPEDGRGANKVVKGVMDVKKATNTEAVVRDLSNPNAVVNQPNANQSNANQSNTNSAAPNSSSADKTTNFPWWIFIVIGAAVLLILLLVFALGRKSSK